MHTGFADFIRLAESVSELVVQPRMGFATPGAMRAGLEAVSQYPGFTAGTLTIDSYTRVGALDKAARALQLGQELNGFPLVNHGAEVTRRMLAGVRSSRFPVQVRHGSPLPRHIFVASAEADIDATEGGPVSYCLPYGRIPLKDSIRAWWDCARLWADIGEERGIATHLESFGGCMLGQLCPPVMLITLSLLEALFFQRAGVRDVSLSYAQGTNADQDVGAMLALGRLAREWLAPDSFHIVHYSFMGVFPRTAGGARQLIEDSARLAVEGGARRLIVKTAAEAHGIPTVADNLTAIGWAHTAARAARGRLPSPAAVAHAEALYEQASFLAGAVLELDADLGTALLRAFKRGYLDVPYCIHGDNRNEARSLLREDGLIEFQHLGRIPLPPSRSIRGREAAVRSDELLRMLRFNQEKYDGGHHADAA